MTLNLNNGADLLAVKPSKDCFIVMAKFNSSFVTWVVKNNEAFWGHYYDNVDEALDDFNSRN